MVAREQMQEGPCKRKLCFCTDCPVLPCRQDLTAAKAAIEELFGKIREIRRKAEASEIMVQEICRDIRKLDFAKTHLTHTITALRRLAMLVNAVGMSLSLCSQQRLQHLACTTTDQRSACRVCVLYLGGDRCTRD